MLNVRSGPGRVYDPPIARLQNGTAVAVIGKQQSFDNELWWLVALDGPRKQGWVFAQYTRPVAVNAVPWVEAPPPPPPPAPPTLPAPTPPPSTFPQATINAPDGFSYAYQGPGWNYERYGAFDNGTVVSVVGKQTSVNQQLWWLISLPVSPSGYGWVYAEHTLPTNTELIPWVNPPSTTPATIVTPMATPVYLQPTPTYAVPLPTPTYPVPTVSAPGQISWRVSGRVVDASRGQPVVGVLVSARFGNTGPFLEAVTDRNGQFRIDGISQPLGDLQLNFNAPGYTAHQMTAPLQLPAVYDYTIIELTPETTPAGPVTWAVFGRVSDSGTDTPIPSARIVASLSSDAIQLETVASPGGEFSLTGQAPNTGVLSITVTAAGYQPLTVVSPQTESRIYSLPQIQLVPVAQSCTYESVINLTGLAGLVQLQTLRFTNVITNPVSVGQGSPVLGRVLAQTPDPPLEGQPQSLSCQTPIVLDVGVLP